MTPQEFLATLTADTAIVVGAASTLVVVGIAVVGSRVLSARVRKLVVRRDPTRVCRVDEYGRAVDIGVAKVGGSAGAAAARSVAAVDVQWARDHGFMALPEYFESLTVAEPVTGDAQRWEKEALMSVAAALGLGAGGVGAVTGVVLNALPKIPRETVVDSFAGVASLPHWMMAALARSVGKAALGATNPFLHMRNGEPAAVAAFQPRLWPPVPAAAAAAPAALAGGSGAGSNGAVEEPLLPATVVLPRDLLAAETAAFGADGGSGPADERVPCTRAHPLAPDLLPGLCLGPGGLLPKHSRREEFYNRYAAAVLNRLLFNEAPRARRCKSEDGEEAPALFKVVVQGDDGGGGGVGDREATTLQEFFQILQDDGALTRAVIQVQDPGGAPPVPLAFTLPLRTEVLHPDTGAHIDVPATHTALGLHIRLPGARTHACTQFYLGIEGFCGFHGDGGYDAPWLNQVLGEPLSPAELQQSVGPMVAMSLAFAEVAKRYRLPAGGYGTLGICNDSVALLELCIRGDTQVANMGGTGTARQRLALVLEEMRAFAAEHGHMDMARSCSDVAAALRRLPCDTLVEPGQAASLARRLLAAHARPPADKHGPPLPNLAAAVAGLHRAEAWWAAHGAPGRPQARP